MSSVKELLSNIAVSAANDDQFVDIYFNSHKLRAVKVQTDIEMQGLLICETAEGATFCIDIESIDAVLEHSLLSLDS